MICEDIHFKLFYESSLDYFNIKLEDTSVQMLTMYKSVFDDRNKSVITLHLKCRFIKMTCYWPDKVWTISELPLSSVNAWMCKASVTFHCPFITDTLLNKTFGTVLLDNC